MTTPVAIMPRGAFNHGPKFVIFGPRNLANSVRWWWRPFMRRGFEHVFAILPMAEGSVSIQGLAWGMVVDWSPHPAGQCALAYLQQFPQAVGVVVMDDTASGVYSPFEPMTCVTVVKAALGVRAPTIVSPKALHDLLIRRGARRFTA